MITFSAGSLTEIAVTGAHCDDIAIGMGGTLLQLCASHPDLRVHALVLSGAGGVREAEERKALASLCPGSHLEVTVLDIPDGRAPQHWGRIKESLHEFRRTCEPQFVFGPNRTDAHQDHRLLAKLLPTEFRNHALFGYEILKWEADSPRANIFFPLEPSTVDDKVRLLFEHYPSQAGHDWFDAEAFRALARVRGVQCHSVYAEAFTAEKLTVKI